MLLLLCLSYFSFANDNRIEGSIFINSPVNQTINNIRKITGMSKKQVKNIIHIENTDLIKAINYVAQKLEEFNIRLAKLEQNKDESAKQAYAEMKNGELNSFDTKTIQSYKQESEEKQQQARAANALYAVRSNSLEQLAESLSKRKDETGKQANEELKNGNLNGAETKLMESYKQECVEEQECIEKQKQTKAADAYALAKVSILKSNYKDAETYYQQAVQLNPNNVLYTNSIPTYNQQLIFVVNQIQPLTPQTTFTNPTIPSINQIQPVIPQTTFTNPSIQR